MAITLPFLHSNSSHNQWQTLKWNNISYFYIVKLSSQLPAFGSSTGNIYMLAADRANATRHGTQSMSTPQVTPIPPTAPKGVMFSIQTITSNGRTELGQQPVHYAPTRLGRNRTTPMGAASPQIHRQKITIASPQTVGRLIVLNEEVYDK